MKMNIKDIMEQMQETPSPRCWESIASQLPAVGAAVGGGAAATAAKGALSAGKLAAIIGSATAVVAIVTGTTIAIVNHEPSSIPPTNPETNTTIIVTENTDTATIDVPALAEVIPAPSVTPAETPITTPSSKPEEISAAEPANNNTPAIPVVTPDNSAPTTVPSITATNPNPANPSVSSNQSNAHHTVSNQNTTAQPSSTQENKAETVQQNNPEIDNTWENAGYSRPVKIEIPNIFTPNGDGVNDFFVISGIENCEKKMLVVKNKNGQTVFQSQNYDNSWDGNNLPNGTYYYQFNYSINNINELSRGTLLIRR